MSQFIFGMFILITHLIACADQGEFEVQSLEEKSSQRPWVSESFSQNHPMSDAFFSDVDALSEAGIQAFLERSPYGRSWLADYQIGGSKASSLIYSVANSNQLNPILLLSRMQVEASLISATATPNQDLIDRAMGCGCPDGHACAPEYLGLRNQIECAAYKFRELYQKSADGSGWWRKGLGKSTLDHYWIVPESHATAALYAYTPWVLKGSGGTWLAWSIAQRFDKHVYDQRFDQIGTSNHTGGGHPSGGSSTSTCGSFSDVNASHPEQGAIEAAVEAGWISGCSPGRFCPDDVLTRAQTASVVQAAFKLPQGSSTTLSDVQSHWARTSIESVISAGIMSGCTTTSFCPDDVLTRAQAAVILSRASHIVGWWDPPFSDVPNDHWAAKEISGLYERDLIGGCSNSEFCPDAPMRRWIYVAWLVNVRGIPRLTCP